MEIEWVSCIVCLLSVSFPLRPSPSSPTPTLYDGILLLYEMNPTQDTQQRIEFLFDLIWVVLVLNNKAIYTYPTTCVPHSLSSPALRVNGRPTENSELRSFDTFSVSVCLSSWNGSLVS